MSIISASIGKVDKSTFDQYVPAHKAYVQELIALGHKVKTGYWAQRGGGMMIFEAASMDEAQALVAGDPLVQGLTSNISFTNGEFWWNNS